MSTQIDGITTLLQIDADGHEYISRYLESEMAEIFTREQRRTLAACGRTLIACDKGRHTQVIDMVHAARAQAFAYATLAAASITRKG